MWGVKGGLCLLDSTIIKYMPSHGFSQQPCVVCMQMLYCSAVWNSVAVSRLFPVSASHSCLIFVDDDIVTSLQVLSLCCCVCCSLGCTQTWVRSYRVCWTSSGKVLLPWCPLVLLAFHSENIRHLCFTASPLEKKAHVLRQPGSYWSKILISKLNRQDLTCLEHFLPQFLLKTHLILLSAPLCYSSMYKSSGMAPYPTQAFHYSSRHGGPSQTPPPGPGPAPSPAPAPMPHPGVDSAHGPPRAPAPYGLISDLPLPVPTVDPQVHWWWVLYTTHTHTVDH